MNETGVAVSVGRRVVVTGMAGSGKSTFPSALGEDRSSGHPSRRPLLEAGLGRADGKRVAGEGRRGLLAGEESIVDDKCSPGRLS